MAKHVFYNASVIPNGVDLSDHVESITVEVALPKFDNTTHAMSQRQYQPGIMDITDPVITFYQDYAPGKVYATFVMLWQNRTIFNLVCRSDAGARATTNPEWTLPVFVAKMPLLGGARGARHMAPVTCTIGGQMTIATS